jgi:2-furoyl-CoA dehydrogenase FAD binding subunit
MKPASFEYVRIDESREALELLAQMGDDARVLAGGQSLVAMLNMRLAQPAALLDITRARDLDYVHADASHLAVGAAATQAEVEHRPTLARDVPLLALVFPWISHVQVRSRGTVCGSLAHADPSAELPLVLVALGGEVVLERRGARRRVAAEDFFTGMLITARGADELLREARFPLARADERFAFREVSRRHGDFALAAFAAIADAGHVTLAVGGVADRPVRKRWKRSDAIAWDAELNDFAWSLGARDDPHASARYRRDLVRNVGRKVLAEVGA